jgi:hypothetical protein
MWIYSNTVESREVIRKCMCIYGVLFKTEWGKIMDWGLKSLKEKGLRTIILKLKEAYIRKAILYMGCKK